ncbi:MAG: transcription termination factor NusA [Defluviitaleaceae bacterium]|nr:transcription termination factor NusA [Defluviitaleaceae bacterium]
MEKESLIEVMRNVAEEKGVDLELVLETLENSLVLACKKHYNAEQEFRVMINRDTGKIECYAKKEVVEEVYDPAIEISLEDANLQNSAYELGDFAEVSVSFEGFSRIAAMTAKQVITQTFRDIERENLYNAFLEKEHKLLVGKIERVEKIRRKDDDGPPSVNVIVTTGKLQGIMTPMSQIRTEQYFQGDRIKVYVSEVKQTTKDPIMHVSRADPALIRLLFENEVPELVDGVVEIKSIAREAGYQTKVAINSLDDDVDPIGTLVGPNGSRINVVVDELNGERIDLIPYSEDIEIFIENALSPSKIISVTVNEEEKKADVIVPKDQLSLAIGKNGQNVRLAVRLTGYKIDLQSDEKMNIANDEEYEEAYREMYDPYENNE